MGILQAPSFERALHNVGIRIGDRSTIMGEAKNNDAEANRAEREENVQGHENIFSTIHQFK